MIEITELNDTPCKTYLLRVGELAALVDPLRDRLTTYRAALSARGLSLVWVLETHTHADHLMLSRASKQALGAPIVMHQRSPSPLVDRHVEEGDVLELGGETIEVLETPGHTPDSVCYRVRAFGEQGAVLTGDTLLLGGSGRCDFPGGDAGQQYDAVVAKLFTLPDATVVFPGHDYKGRTRSTIGDEKRENPRFLGKSRAEYIALMAALGLPFPEKIQESLQVNQSGFEACDVSFPAVSDVRAIVTLSSAEVRARLASSSPPLLLDVREPEEFVGKLGHIEGALLVPLDALEQRLPKLAGYVEREIVVICRAGARSASAGALLEKAGFRAVFSLQGGMLSWIADGLPIQR